MDKKNKLGTLISGVKKTTKNMIDNAVQTVDQNSDGKFDFSDLSIIAETVGDAVKKGTQSIKESADEKAKQHELKLLQPIFEDSLTESDFLMPKFVRVAEREKKYVESAVCQDSVGYNSNNGGFRYINIFKDSLDAFAISFYPDSDGEFYYRDPSDRDRYIALDEYFNFLKVARVNELQKIAQDLGAKYFKVTYKEEKSSFSDKRAKANVNIATVAKADAEHSSTEKNYSTVHIEAEMEFPGHVPVEPELKYLQREPNIQTLIAMRMNEKSPLMNQKYMLRLSDSSGMKENDAVKIDAVLKGLKCAGNTTVASEAKNESRRYLEYEIRF